MKAWVENQVRDVVYFTRHVHLVNHPLNRRTMAVEMMGVHHHRRVEGGVATQNLLHEKRMGRRKLGGLGINRRYQIIKDSMLDMVCYLQHLDVKCTNRIEVLGGENDWQLRDWPRYVIGKVMIGK